MKLLSSFKKEMVLATRSFYFYIELGVAVIILAVLLFAIPENAEIRSTEYIYFDMPQQTAEYALEAMLEGEEAAASETEVKVGDEAYGAALYATSDTDIYLMRSEEAVEAIAKDRRQTGIVVGAEDGVPQVTYYLQGYESQRLKNLLRVLNIMDISALEEKFDALDVREVQSDYVPLNNRQNMLAPLMMLNGSLMGMFIIAAYIFLDKGEGVIKAYAVTASPVSRYLMSKTMVLIVTSVVTGIVIAAPVMGGQANYPLLILLLITSGFFVAALGLLLSSFFRDMMKAFGVIFLVIVLFMVPGIAYMVPSWNPVWMNVIPSQHMVEGFKEVFTIGGDWAYALIASAGFTAAGALVFWIANMRFKRSLAV